MAKKTTKTNDGGACEALRELILRNPALTREQVQEKATAAGHTVSDSTAKTVHYAVHSTLRSLSALGFYAHAGMAASHKSEKPAKVEKEKVEKPAKAAKKEKAKA